MAMQFGPALGDDEDQPMAAINTTPLVDVMLVLLIIFLIAIPVVTHSVPVVLPKETAQIGTDDPAAPTIAIDRAGNVYWDRQPVDDGQLTERLTVLVQSNPQSSIRVRGDQDAAFAAVSKVLSSCARTGIAKVSFITEPPPGGPHGD